jgi:RNA polymerase sigma-70 factor (ECF subfamily)
MYPAWRIARGDGVNLHEVFCTRPRDADLVLPGVELRWTTPVVSTWAFGAIVGAMLTADELAAAFAAAYAHPRERVIDVDVGARLVALCAAARGARPGLGIDDRELARAIGERAPADGLAGYLERCRADDLALAIAAARGNATAIAELEREFRTTIDAACRRFAGPGQTADDLRQILRARLFVAEAGRAPKIADYGGQGFLDNWLRVTAVRTFLDLGKRKDRARELPAGDDDVLALPEPGDLALDVIKAEYRSAVAAAMVDAAHSLDPGDRHLLRQHLVAHVTIDQLGSVLGIHRATAARRVAKAREQLVAETRRQLAVRLGLADAELDDVIALVMSRLDVSIAKLLATEAR